jgi:hypothetical protein
MPLLNFLQRITFILLFLSFFSILTVKADEKSESTNSTPTKPTTNTPSATTNSSNKISKDELEKVADKLIDPLSDLWFVFMTNYTTNLFNETTNKNYKMNQFILQPVLPYVIKKDKIILMNRPSFLVTTVPDFKSGGYDTYVTNFSWSSILGYKTDFGLIYGVGPAISFPAHNKISTPNYRVGGTSIFYYMQPKFVTGFNYSHYVDLENEEQRQYTNTGVLQYVFTYRITPLLSIASASQVEMIYTSKGLEYNLPIGVSISKTFSIGKLPLSFGVGYQYVVKNNQLVEEANLKQDHRVSFTLMTVLPNPFHLDKFK